MREKNCIFSFYSYLFSLGKTYLTRGETINTNLALGQEFAHTPKAIAAESIQQPTRKPKTKVSPLEPILPGKFETKNIPGGKGIKLTSRQANQNTCLRRTGKTVPDTGVAARRAIAITPGATSTAEGIP